MATCKECLHVAVCGRYAATGGRVRDCEHFAGGSRWISVKDRLPEPGERVLVCIGAVFEAFIDDAGKWQRYYSAPLNEVLGEPTHWMPLPEPPKEVE